MKLALCVIVKPTENEGRCLARLLTSVAQYADGVFITQAGDAPNEYVSSVIKLYKAHESFYRWDKSFANARNYNFSQVPEDYTHIMWFDADDVVENGQLIRETIENHPSVDTFSFWYHYAFDQWDNPVVVHHKTRIIRNDGSIKWVGDLHEDFGANREVISKHVESIIVKHRTDEERLGVAKKRNIEVARNQVLTYSNDPRSYWNLANSLNADGQLPEALNVFNKFLELSHSSDEKYIAKLRKSEILWEVGQKQLAVEEMQSAVGLKPTYPDAYVKLGEYYYHLAQYDEAVTVLKHALKLPKPTYEIIVFNPYDYRYTPLRWLAYSYLAVEQPMLAYECFRMMLEDTPKDESLRQVVANMKQLSDQYEKMLKHYARIKEYTGDKLRKALDDLPDDFKSAPMFCNLRNINFIKKDSSGKDVVFMCGMTSFEWNPKVAKEKGIGGSEEAVIHLAKNLADRGYNVEVYCHCGHKPLEFDGVKYKPFWTWNYRDKQDVVILWRHPKFLDYQINAPKIFVDMHDVVPAGEFTATRVKKLTKVFVKSEFHKSLFNLPDDKVVVVPNGIVVEDFAGPVEKEPFLIINTSSPDRSLSKLVKLFKRIKERVPEAVCEWAYGWDGFENNVANRNPDARRWMDNLKAEMENTPGFIVRGRVHHGEVAKMYKRARIFAYPTEFAEIDCISARKAQAGGALPVTTDFAALKETVRHGVKLKSAKTKDNWCLPYQFDFAMSDELDDKFVEAVVTELQTPYLEDTEMRSDMERYSWSNITDTWEEEIKK